MIQHSRLKGLDEQDPYVIYFADYIENLRRYQDLQRVMRDSKDTKKLEIEREIAWTEHAIDKAIESMQRTLENLTSR
jgi:precorrin-3B methylase